jgi:serine/threonine-protein kinase
MAEKRLIAGRYEILAEIGRGGMGVVAHAYDHRLDTDIAIKVLHEDFAKDSGEKDSLIKEARVLAKLSHPSIVRLFDLADTEAGLMLILEYVRGPNLAQVLRRRKKLSTAELLHVMRQICEGLAAAHAAGVIHRDLKPPNILVAAATADLAAPDFLLRSTVKITDFGISKLLAPKRQTAGTALAADRTGIGGTPLFMAPEQFEGLASSPATDIYALGVIVYIALAGHPPFASDDMAQVAMQHLLAAPAPIGDCGEKVNAVIQKALAKKPEQRFPTAIGFFHALEAACNPPAPPVVPDLPLLEPDELDRASEWLYRARWRIAGCVILLIAAAVWLLTTRAGPSASAPIGRIEEEAAAHPSPGKIIHLPEDLDVAPPGGNGPALPAGISVQEHPGPQRPPHIVWTAWSEERDALEFLRLDGVAGDGTAYIRDDASQSLWAVNDSAFLSGFRTPMPSNPAYAGANNPNWPSYRNLSPAVRPALPPMLPVSSDFSEHSKGKRWTLQLDSQPAQALLSDGQTLVLTKGNTVYSFDSAGHLEWNYASPDTVHKIARLPSGMVLLIAGQGHNTMRAIRAGAKQWEFTARDWIRDFGVVDSAGSLYFLTSGYRLSFYGLRADGKPLWSWVLAGPTSSSETLRIDDAGRLYVSGARVDIAGTTRRAVICLAE